MAAELKCIKCGSAMIRGFVLDCKSGMKMKQLWVKGAPEESLWSGPKTSDRETFNTLAFRCADCNYLEFYTTDRVYI